jgi:hypothetical protein
VPSESDVVLAAINLEKLWLLGEAFSSFKVDAVREDFQQVAADSVAGFSKQFGLHSLSAGAAMYAEDLR